MSGMPRETRTITDLAMLMDLPPGSVIMAASPAGAMEKHPTDSSGGWWGAGSHVTYRAELVPLPAELLWTP